MSCFPYLILTRLKNKIKGILKKPAYLIYILLMAALLIFVIIAGNMDNAESINRLRDTAELRAGMCLVYSLIFVLVAKSGFDSGSTLFTLSDVNMIFTAPVGSRSVLFYGLCQQLGTSLLMGLFLLFQYSWMHQLYGVGIGGLLLIVLGYALTIFAAQITALLLYILTSGNSSRKRVAQIVFYGIFGVFALAIFIYGAVDRANFMPRAVSLIDSAVGRFIPPGGMIGALFGGLIFSKTPAVILGGILSALYFAVAVTLIFVSQPDFYEDVLQSSERNHETKAAAKAGRVAESAPKKMRLGSVGLDKGEGASVFYYKHLLENRRSRSFILSGQSLIFALVVIGFAFIMRENGVIPVLVFSGYMQMFSVGLGRLLKELTKPYIYLVPEPPFRKLLWGMRESLPTFLLEAIVIFIPVGIILSLSVLNVIACILVRAGISFLFLTGNLVCERVFGEVVSQVLIFLFYFLILAVMLIPGGIVTILFYALELYVVSQFFTCCLVFFAVNLAVTLLGIFLCRNILEYAELRN